VIRPRLLPAQYPQEIEITRPMGDKLWFDYQGLPWDTWVRPTEKVEVAFMKSTPERRTVI
jgi:hypothetical protein